MRDEGKGEQSEFNKGAATAARIYRELSSQKAPVYTRKSYDVIKAHSTSPSPRHKTRWKGDLPRKMSRSSYIFGKINGRVPDCLSINSTH